MLHDRNGDRLWIADETGEFELLRPGGGFNGRTRNPGEPDWWVVAKSPDWVPPGLLLSAAAVEDSSGGGWGKLAGADSEAGRREPPPGEPASLLSATAEHLEKMGKGIGQALDKGAEGAGQALEKTWDALTGNKDLHKGVEFGVKAAWEVSKDVGKEAGGDALGALWGYGVATKVAPLFGIDPVTSLLRNRGWRMGNDGYDLLDGAARRAWELDRKIRGHLPGEGR